MAVIGEVVSVRVEKIFPFGIFVRLEDGRRGYIRRRELPPNGQSTPETLVHEGQTLSAQVVGLPEAGLCTELSLRALAPDPWEAFARGYKVGDVISGMITQLAPDRLFVQIIPGVNGRVYLAEMAPWKLDRPDELFSVGDWIEAMITHIDVATRKVVLSINRRLEKLSQAEAIAVRLQEEAALEAESDRRSLPVMPGEAPQPPARVHLAGSILVVEDDPSVRVPLTEWLTGLGCRVLAAADGETALQLWKQARADGGSVTMLLVDRDLPQVNGIELIDTLARLGTEAAVAVMSGAEVIEADYAELQRLGVAAVFAKPLDLDELLLFLQRVAAGERPVLASTPPAGRPWQQPVSFTHLAGQVRREGPVTARLQTGLHSLVQATRAEWAAVFHYEPETRQVSILAQGGAAAIDGGAIYSLASSPVKDLIMDGGKIWEGNVSAGLEARFRKLLDLLPFESVIGIPIQTEGPCRHAVFLFHTRLQAFTRLHLRDTLAAAALFASTLERQELEARLQSVGRLLLNGQLAAAFNHELNNKLSSFDLQMNNLRREYHQHASCPPAALGGLDAFGAALDSAAEKGAELRNFVADFRRLMETKEQQELLSVNDVLHSVVGQLRHLYKQKNIEIITDFSPDLPSVCGSSSAFCQVFLNLALNAIQQMTAKPDPRRSLTISTRYRPAECLPVKIRFSDTGPGIHHQWWERIFELGFTTRPEGSGLGLFLCRILIEAAGGRVAVEESYIPLGATFIIELPGAVDRSAAGEEPYA